MYRTCAALLLSTTLLGGGAVAQTSAPSTAAPGTATTAPATPTGKFVTTQGMGEFRASKFVGLDIYGSDNEKIGDISEILLDGQGSAKAVVIGVGGFLGMGQKNVAVPWSAITWSNDAPAARTAASGSAPTPGGAAPATTGTAPATTGTTIPGTAPMGGAGTTPATQPARSPAEQAAYNGYPNHGKVTLTKAELQEAPAYQYYSDMQSNAPARPR